MVTEKESDVQHDFLNDPIRLQLRGEWLGVGTLALAMLATAPYLPAQSSNAISSPTFIQTALATWRPPAA